MANKFYTPEQAAALTVALVSEEAQLSALVARDMTSDFLGGGGKGKTVNVKVPTALVAHARGIDDTTNAIIMDELSETTVPLSLGVHAYNAVPLSEGDLTLNLKDFGGQVLAPQASAVAAYIEDMVLAKLQAEEDLAATGKALNGKWASANPVTFFTALRKLLRERGVPAANINVAVGTGVYAKLLDANLLTDASQSGSTAALREAQIGRLRGFTVVERVDLAEGEIVAWHRDAFQLATRAPLKPEGASFGATASAKGFTFRYLRDYDMNVTRDRSLVSTFAGIAKMPLYKVTRTQDIGKQGDTAPAFVKGSAAVVEVPGGAAVRAVVTP